MDRPDLKMPIVSTPPSVSLLSALEASGLPVSLSLSLVSSRMQDPLSRTPFFFKLNSPHTQQLGDSPDIRCKITLSGTLKWMIMFNGLPCALSAESSKSAWRRVRGKPSKIQLYLIGGEK
jgi:hypothetical protein